MLARTGIGPLIGRIQSLQHPSETTLHGFIRARFGSPWCQIAPHVRKAFTDEACAAYARTVGTQPTIACRWVDHESGFQPVATFPYGWDDLLARSWESAMARQLPGPNLLPPPIRRPVVIDRSPSDTDGK